MNVTEVYTPQPMAANASFNTGGQALGGFFATTAGSLAVSGGTTVAAFPVAVSVWYPLPFATPGGCTVTLTGGAAGTLGYVQ